MFSVSFGLAVSCVPALTLDQKPDSITVMVHAVYSASRSIDIPTCSARDSSALRLSEFNDSLLADANVWPLSFLSGFTMRHAA